MMGTSLGRSVMYCVVLANATYFFVSDVVAKRVAFPFFCNPNSPKMRRVPQTHTHKKKKVDGIAPVFMVEEKVCKM